jgi:hypothetical protein
MTVFLVYLTIFAVILGFWGFHIRATRRLADAIAEHNARMREYHGQTDLIGFHGTKITFFDVTAPTPTMDAGKDETKDETEKRRVGFV